MIFKGRLCIIKDGKGKLVEELDIKYGEVIRGVLTRYNII